MIDLAKTNPKWLGFAAEGYVFAALVYFVFCYSMSRYSQKLEKRLVLRDKFMSSKIIELKDVNKWFGEFQVLKDISLTVNQKEKIVICGPSGSGNQR